MEMQELPVLAVMTRAQSRKEQQQLVADQKATDSSGVVLSPVEGEQPEEQPASDCDVADESESEEVITRSQFIEFQQQDAELQDMLLTADTPDSMFLLKEGILYTRRLGLREETGKEFAGLAVVVPVPLRRRVIAAGHNLAGHIGVKKTKRWWRNSSTGLGWAGTSSFTARVVPSACSSTPRRPERSHSTPYP